MEIVLAALLGGIIVLIALGKAFRIEIKHIHVVPETPTDTNQSTVTEALKRKKEERSNLDQVLQDLNDIMVGKDNE